MKKVQNRLFLLLMLFPLILQGAASINLESILNDIHKKNGNIQTLEAEFTQEKQSPILLTPLKVEGTLYFQKTEKNKAPEIKWIYKAPYAGWHLISNNHYQAYTEDLKQLEIYELEDEQSALELLSALDLCPQKIDKLLQKNYQVEITQSEKSYILEFSPKQDAQKALFQKLTLEFNIQTLAPETVVFQDETGDSNHYAINKVTFNPAFKEDTFKPVPPEGTTIMKMTEQEGITP